MKLKFVTPVTCVGKTVDETEDLIREEIENKWVAMDTRIASIGPPGENLVLVGSHHER